MAWSWHEIVSDFVRPSLAWFESGGRANLDKLVKVRGTACPHLAAAAR